MLITTTHKKQGVEAAPGVLRDNGTGTAQSTSAREQMTETETATPQNIIHRNQKEVKRVVTRLADNFRHKKFIFCDPRIDYCSLPL